MELCAHHLTVVNMSRLPCRVSRKSRRAESVSDAEDFVIPAGYVAKVDLPSLKECAILVAVSNTT